MTGEVKLWTNCSSKKALTCLTTVGIGAFVVRRFVIPFFRRKRLQKMIEEKKKYRNNNIDIMRSALASASPEVQSRREEIINADFETLRSLLSNDTYRPTEVLEAYQARALKAHDLTNCVCEFLHEAAIWAEDLEAKFYKSDKKPLLYGVPISVKECNKMKGHDVTAGFAQFLDQPADRDSALVAVLKNLGAIPFVLTNIPQSMMSIGCSNPIYGVTSNPFDAGRCCGGSSGGEGALISLRGSPLGIGTDVGGSVRIPAHFCGIYSLKPTVARMPQGGRRGAMPGLTIVQGTAGPMGVDVDSLLWFCRGVWSADSTNLTFHRNPYVTPLPFNEELFTSKSPLTIGYYDFDGFLEPTPACKRAVQVAKTALEAVGYTVVPITPPDLPYLYRLYMGSVFLDGGAYVTSTFKNDIVDRFHKKLVNYLALSPAKKRFIGLLASLFCSPRDALPYVCYAKNISQLRRIFELLTTYREKFVNLWLDSGLDCVLCPVHAAPALPSDVTPNMYLGGWSYCALYNALDFPAGVLPVTTVSNDDERDLERYPAKDGISRLIKNSAKSSVGLPVGVQIVGLPFREEMCLRVMKDLETSLRSA